MWTFLLHGRTNLPSLMLCSPTARSALTPLVSGPLSKTLQRLAKHLGKVVRDANCGSYILPKLTSFPLSLLRQVYYFLLGYGDLLVHGSAYRYQRLAASTFTAVMPSFYSLTTCLNTGTLQLTRPTKNGSKQRDAVSRTEETFLLVHLYHSRASFRLAVVSAQPPRFS